MQVTAHDQMADLVASCLSELDEIEAAYVQDCYLLEPPVPLAVFSKHWRLSAKALSEVRKRALTRLKDVMAKKGITSVADIM